MFYYDANLINAKLKSKMKFLNGEQMTGLWHTVIVRIETMNEWLHRGDEQKAEEMYNSILEHLDEVQPYYTGF